MAWRCAAMMYGDPGENSHEGRGLGGRAKSKAVTLVQRVTTIGEYRERVRSLMYLAPKSLLQRACNVVCGVIYTACGGRSATSPDGLLLWSGSELFSLQCNLGPQLLPEDYVLRSDILYTKQFSFSWFSDVGD